MDNPQKAQIILKEIQIYLKDLRVDYKDDAVKKHVPPKLILVNKLKQLSCLLKEMEILL